MKFGGDIFVVVRIEAPPIFRRAADRCIEQRSSSYIDTSTLAC